MDKMLSVSELSKITEIPESTVRRYISKFEAYFQYDARGKGKKYHPESVKVLKRIAALYSEDYQAHEIESVLATQFSFAINNQQDTTNQLPATIEQQFEEFKQQQDEFNRQLLERLDRQENYIKKLLEERAQPLLQNPQDTQPEEKKGTTEALNTKKWWHFWK